MAATAARTAVQDHAVASSLQATSPPTGSALSAPVAHIDAHIGPSPATHASPPITTAAPRRGGDGSTFYDIMFGPFLGGVGDPQKTARMLLSNAGLMPDCILSTRALRIGSSQNADLSIRVREVWQANALVDYFREPNQALDGLCAWHRPVLAGGSDGGGNRAPRSLPLTTEQKLAVSKNSRAPPMHAMNGVGRGGRSTLQSQPTLSVPSDAQAHDPIRWLSIQCWNIGGQFAAKYDRAEVRDCLRQCDISVVQETWLRPRDGDAIRDLNGYDTVHLPRPDMDLTRQWGGTIAFVRRGFGIVVSPLSTTDLLVLNATTFWIVAAYLPPDRSDWRRWTDTDPWDRITEVLSFLASDPDKTVILVGDLNMRTGQLQAGPQPSDFPRVCHDLAIDTRGRAFLRLCDQLDLRIVNGTCLETSTPGALTSFQKHGSTTIDYL
ncbi:hypothetical protein K525DRAFT_275431, partial [Schizophyllum commune Loenen D]